MTTPLPTPKASAVFNCLIPSSVQHVTSPYNIYILSCKQVMRILTLIRQKLLP